MDPLRRTLLKGITTSGLLVAAIAAGALRPSRVLAADWNKGGFEAKDIASVLKAIDAVSATESRDIVINAPDIAEDGAMVPIEVISNIPGTLSIAVVVEKNPYPLAAQFDFSNGTLPQVSLRLKMSQTSQVIVSAKAGGKVYIARTEIKVTVGGCAN